MSGRSDFCRLSKILTGLLLTTTAVSAAQYAPATSPLYDDLLQLSLRSGRRAPGQFTHFSTQRQIEDYLTALSPHLRPSPERGRYRLLQQHINGTAVQLPLAIVPRDATLPRLYPIWSGMILTDGEETMPETVNGFNLIWEPAGSIGLKLHFQDATVHGGGELFTSPAWYPSRKIAWTMSSVKERTLHDELEGGIFYGGAKFSAFLGRDYLRLGREPQFTTMVGDYLPAANQLLLNYTTGSLSAHYTLAELHSNQVEITDPSWWQGKPHDVPVSKFLAYHRFAWRGEKLELGVSDMVVFSEQPFRLGYLNPVSFFWSEEHFSGDNDNSLLALDFSLLNPGWEIWSELLLDDLTFSRFFSNYPVNKTAAVTGIRWAAVDGLLLTGSAGFARPFVYTHFHAADDFRHEGRLLSSLLPNSLNYYLAGRYLLTAHQRLEASWRYSRQGVGYLENGVYHNVGSSFHYPTFDQEAAFPFLAGRQEYRQQLTAGWYLLTTPPLPWTDMQLDCVQLSLHYSHYREALAINPDGIPNRHTNSYDAAWLKLTLDHDHH